MRNILTIAITAAGLAACNNANEAFERPGDTTAVLSPDTSSAAIPPGAHMLPRIVQRRRAVLGYSFFKCMRQHDVRPVHAYVSMIDSSGKIIYALGQMNREEHKQERECDTATVIPKDIFVYKYLTIELTNGADSAFSIAPASSHQARQMVDTLGYNRWDWTVTPTTSRRSGTLVLTVTAESPDSNADKIEPRNLEIQINLDTNFVRPILNWLRENPERLLVLILIPLIVFFWKQIVALFGRKPKKQ